MKFTFTTKRVEIPDDLKAYAEKKISKLDRYFRQDSDAHIVFSTERGRETVEITIHHGAMYFRVRQTTQDFYASIDTAIEALVRQIHKNKTRLEKRLRQGAFERVSGSPENAVENVTEDEYDIIRTKRFAVKPISPEEAILHARGAPSAPVVPQAVLCQVAIVRVPGPHEVFDLFVRRRVGVDISD
jgi:putative sigma-54 modulation protein